MEAAYALLLGLLQGLTEFLPISSTAHLRILPALLGQPDPGAAFTAVIQLGSLAALLVYFRRDLLEFSLEVVRGLISRQPLQHPQARLAWQVVAATIPICIAAMLLKDFIHGPFRSLYVVAGSLIVMALLLWLADRNAGRQRDVHSITFRDAIWIGLAQCLALIPGASRSGSTLMMGLFLGLARPAATRFSFLLAIPAIALSGFYELYSEWSNLAAQGFSFLILGSLAAIVSSYLAIAGLLHYLRSHNLSVFVAYRTLLGLAILALLALGMLSP
ncbi:MAG: undecaprenyl-diphosphatase UppP [Leptospirales bacterium]|nr:undecaprenyl-diphosphatase UppP [Leptospirales bacterium]